MSCLVEVSYQSYDCWYKPHQAKAPGLLGRYSASVRSTEHLINILLEVILHLDMCCVDATFADPVVCSACFSFLQDLDLVEAWGVLGARTTWQRMPSQLFERLKLLVFGFPANPQQQQRRPELFGASIQWRQQQGEQWQQWQQQEQQGLGGLVTQPAVAVVAVEEEQESALVQQQGEERVWSSFGACTSTALSETGSTSSSSSSGTQEEVGVWKQRQEVGGHEGPHNCQQQPQQQPCWDDDPGHGDAGQRRPGSAPPSSSVAAAAADLSEEELLCSAGPTADADASMAVADADTPSVVVLGSSSREGSLASVVPLVGGLAKQNGGLEREHNEQAGGISEVEVQRQWQQLQQKRRQYQQQEQQQGSWVPASAAGGAAGDVEDDADGVLLRKAAPVPAAVVAVTNTTIASWTAGSGSYGWRSTR